MLTAVLRFVAFRLLQSLIALAILSVVVFVLARATGDPLHMILPMSATAEDYDNARKYLGLDRPYVEQYLSFVGRAVTGDFGNSIRARRPVIELLQARLPNSLKLAAFATPTGATTTASATNAPVSRRLIVERSFLVVRRGRRQLGV